MYWNTLLLYTVIKAVKSDPCLKWIKAPPINTKETLILLSRICELQCY